MHMNSFEALTWGTVATAIGSAFMLVMIGCGLAEPERGQLQGDRLLRAPATATAQAARQDAPALDSRSEPSRRGPSLPGSSRRELPVTQASPVDH